MYSNHGEMVTDNIKYSHVAMATENHIPSTAQKQDLSPSVFIIPTVYFSEHKSKVENETHSSCILVQNLREVANKTPLKIPKSCSLTARGMES